MPDCTGLLTAWRFELERAQGSRLWLLDCGYCNGCLRPSNYGGAEHKLLCFVPPCWVQSRLGMKESTHPICYNDRPEAVGFLRFHKQSQVTNVYFAAMSHNKLLLDRAVMRVERHRNYSGGKSPAISKRKDSWRCGRNDVFWLARWNEPVYLKSWRVCHKKWGWYTCVLCIRWGSSKKGFHPTDT